MSFAVIFYNLDRAGHLVRVELALLLLLLGGRVARGQGRSRWDPIASPWRRAYATRPVGLHTLWGYTTTGAVELRGCPTRRRRRRGVRVGRLGALRTLRRDE